MIDMKDRQIISRCGYRCDLCLAYTENIESREDKETISDGWFRYFGFRIPPKFISCDGCLTPDSEEPTLMDNTCPVRGCVKEHGLKNCSRCDDIPCEKFETRAVDRKDFEDVTEEDYQMFIRPYENRRRLVVDE